MVAHTRFENLNFDISVADTVLETFNDLVSFLFQSQQTLYFCPKLAFEIAIMGSNCCFWQRARSHGYRSSSICQT